MTFEGPSQQDNLATKGRSPEYLKVLAELEEILGKSEEEQRAYVMERVTELSEASPSTEMSHLGHSIHKGFLGPDIKIRRSMLVDPFVMDDPELYLELFKTIRKFKSAEGWKEKSLREMMTKVIQWTLTKYFGNIEGGISAEMKNREFYMDHSGSDIPSISIKELQGKSIAVCAEKGAAAQNLISFVGMESELIAANGCRIPEDAPEGAHYFILLHAPKGEFLFDPTNPRLLFNADGTLKDYGPAMYPLSEEQALKLEYGQSVTVEHSDDKVIESGEMTAIKSKRLYAGPKQR